ncbi:MAG: putative sulfate exporter family transporter, partial [Sphingomonas sp.]|nr:putative sulfate exporter family transporter [Sphingomonas sp.]
YSPGAGDIAAIVKLTRVALLAPALAVVALYFPKEGSKTKGPGIPWFVVGFFVVAGIHSLGVIPPIVATGAEKLATAALAAAVTATAIRSPMRQLLEAGPKPLLVIGAATLAALVLAGAAAVFVIG